EEVGRMDDPVAHHAVHHLPVGAHLAEGRVERMVPPGQRYHVVGALGPELLLERAAGLPQHGLAPQLVDAEDQLGVVVIGGLLGQASLLSLSKPGGATAASESCAPRAAPAWPGRWR